MQTGVESFLPKHPELNKDNVMDILKEEVGHVFVGVLEDAGVYKMYTGRKRSLYEIYRNTVKR